MIKYLQFQVPCAVYVIHKLFITCRFEIICIKVHSAVMKQKQQIIQYEIGDYCYYHIKNKLDFQMNNYTLISLFMQHDAKFIQFTLEFDV